MAYVAVDEDGYEYIFSDRPVRDEGIWRTYYSDSIRLPYGSIGKLIGRELTWEDEPVELENEE